MDGVVFDLLLILRNFGFWGNLELFLLGIGFGCWWKGIWSCFWMVRDGIWFYWMLVEIYSYSFIQEIFYL